MWGREGGSMSGWGWGGGSPHMEPLPTTTTTRTPTTTTTTTPVPFTEQRFVVLNVVGVRKAQTHRDAVRAHVEADGSITKGPLLSYHRPGHAHGARACASESSRGKAVGRKVKVTRSSP